MMRFQGGPEGPQLRAGLCGVLLLLTAVAAAAATADVADAAKRGHRAAVQAALARKADVNLPQPDGTTALHWAVERDDLELTDVLLRAGARVTARTREGVTPLQHARRRGFREMVRILEARGGN